MGLLNTFYDGDKQVQLYFCGGSNYQVGDSVARLEDGWKPVGSLDSKYLAGLDYRVDKYPDACFVYVLGDGPPLFAMFKNKIYVGIADDISEAFEPIFNEDGDKVSLDMVKSYAERLTRIKEFIAVNPDAGIMFNFAQIAHGPCVDVPKKNTVYQITRRYNSDKRDMIEAMPDTAEEVALYISEHKDNEPESSLAVESWIEDVSITCRSIEEMKDVLEID